MQLRRAKRLKYVGRKLLRIRIFCPVLPHSIGYYRGIGQCIGGRKSRKFKQTFSRRIKRKVPDFSRNQELFGGDYWTRTSDLLRVNSPMKLFLIVSSSFLIVSAPIRLFSGRDLLHKIRLFHKLLWYTLWSESRCGSWDSGFKPGILDPSKCGEIK